MTDKLVSTGTYKGGRDGRVWFVTSRQGAYQIDPCLDVRNHSPTGFAWGYCGSGPAQLALAICCHFYRHDAARAECVYEHFKAEVIAGLETGEPWELSTVDVANSLVSIENRFFDRAYKALSLDGLVDTPGGMEYTRVRKEWLEAGRPMNRNLRDWIYQRANIGPNG